MFYRLITSIFVIVYCTSCSSIDSPVFRAIERFEVVSLGLDQVRIGVGITYDNANNFSVSVKETDSNVYVDGVLLGRFAQDSAVQVGRKAPFTIQLTGTIPLLTFVELDLQKMHEREVVIRVEGDTKVGRAGIYISRNIRYEGRHRLNRIRF